GVAHLAQGSGSDLEVADARPVGQQLIRRGVQALHQLLGLHARQPSRLRARYPMTADADRCKRAATEDGRGKTLYMVIERFKNGDAVPVYRRFRDRGRMTPDGLVYVSSWVDQTLQRCYQLMESDDRALLDEWMAKWNDLADFEVHQVMTSKEA